MQRRTYLAALGGLGVAGAGGVGIGLAESGVTLSDPTLVDESQQRRSLTFETDGEELANFGADGAADGDRIDVSTELWHRDRTRVRSLRLRVAMPSPDGDAAQVAVVSPVEGDSSPPPSLTLSTPRDRRGTVIDIRDFDDLADETISTLGLTVDPPSGATRLTLDSTIELATTDVLSPDYTLKGAFDLVFPSLGGE